MKAFLKELVNTPRPCGWSKMVSKFLVDKIKKECKENVSFFVSNNTYDVIASKGASLEKNPKRVIFSAHVDQNALMISEITDEGFLKFISVGGITARTIIDSNFLILANEGEKKIPAICSYKAIHIEMENKENKEPKIKDLVLDAGCNSKDEVEAMGVCVGDYAIFDQENSNFSFGKDEKYVLSGGLDDGVACAVIYKTFQEIEEKFLIDNNIRLYIAFVGGEEIGAGNVYSVVDYVKPDISIDLDVTHDESKTIGESVSGNNVKLTYGPVVCYGPEKNRDLNLRLKAIAESEKIPYQVQAHRLGGTHTCYFYKYAPNCITTLISIPCLYMHSGTKEKCAWDDMKNAEKLLIAYLKTLKK